MTQDQSKVLDGIADSIQGMRREISDLREVTDRDRQLAATDRGEIKAGLDRLEKRVWRGNGQPSLTETQAAEIERLNALQRRVDAISAKAQEPHAPWKRWGQILLVAGSFAYVVAVLVAIAIGLVDAEAGRALLKMLVPAASASYQN